MRKTKKRDPETRYNEKLHKQQQVLEEFAAHEIEFADDLLLWYRVRKEDMPDEVYRAICFFLNKEFLKKPGSLTLLYSVYQKCSLELPAATRENAFSLLSFRFKMYSVTLTKGGF